MSLIPFAQSIQHNRLVDVTEVPRGSKCQCICPSCKMELIARQGEKNEHHFAHYKNADKDCTYSYWVSVKDMAKQIIKEASYLHIDKERLYASKQLAYAQTYSKIIINEYMEPQHCDFILNTSIGNIVLELITPEHISFFERNNEHYFSSKLLLEIDLSNSKRINHSSKKEELKKFILNNLESKKFVLPRMSLYRFDAVGDEGMDLEPPKIYEIDYSLVDDILKELYLDKRNLSSYTLNIVGNMKKFHDFCTKEITKENTHEYEVLYIEEGFRYIAYRQHYFCYAKINSYHVLYEFHKNTFVKLLNSIDYKNVYTAMDDYIAGNHKDIDLSCIKDQTKLHIYKKTYIDNKKILNILDLDENILTQDDIRTVNTMVNFSNRVLRRNRQEELTSSFSIIENGCKLWLTSYHEQFYCIAEISNKFYIYQIIELEQIVYIEKTFLFSDISNKIDSYLDEIKAAF